VTRAAADGVTIFFSSHHIAEVEQISDHVAIVDRGRTVLAGALDDIRAQYRRVQLVFDAAAPGAALRSPGIARIERHGRVMTLLCSRGADLVVDEARALGPTSVDIVPVTLKEIFLEIAKGEEA
jgi:ABC-2 type transport system ATP-binding protein